MNSGDPVGDFRENWEQLAAQARDEKLFGGGYDRPHLVLIEASRESRLRGRSRTYSRPRWNLVETADTSFEAEGPTQLIATP